MAGLTKSFGRIKAVRGVDFNIAPGQTVALLGPNGAGKTTTIDMVLGLQRPDGGRIAVFGLEPARAVKAGRVGAMLQVGSLVKDLSVRELVSMVSSLYPNTIGPDRALALAGLTDIAKQRTQTLSGGQSQRARFAIAVVGNPDLLVLDEPTAALDVEARREFWKSMRAVAAQGKTVLFATHYLEEADAFADRVILMAHGRVVADGTPQEVKARVNVRTIRGTLSSVSPEALAQLPGVASAEVRGDSFVMRCPDSDTALRALLSRYAEARHIEVMGGSLEEAFIELTGGDAGAPEEGA